MSAARAQPPMASAGGSFRPDIQGLRAVAVVLVVLCHGGVPMLDGGYIGVDVFFVISGFLITGFLMRRAERRGRVQFAEFYAARARRILPVVTLMIVATVVASWHLLNYIRAVSVFSDAVWATFFAANVHFAQVGTNYFAQDSPPSPLQNLWTLAVEEQFYLAWPALLAVILLAARGRRPVVIGATAGLCAASLGFCIWDTQTSQITAYFSTAARGWELGFGALIALLAPQLTRIPAAVRGVMSWAGLAGIVVAATTFTAATAFPGYAALLPVVAAGLVVAGGLGRPPRCGAGSVLGRQPFQFVGDTSYSFYLWHWPILVITAEYLGRPLSVAENLGLLLVALGLSAVTYWAVENPFRRAEILARPRAALALWPAAVTMVLGLASVAVASEPALAAAPPPRRAIVVRPLGSYTQAVMRSVTAARLASPVPAVLYPSVGQLAQDGPAGCIRRGGLGLRCTLGDPKAPRTLAVLGDSHAAAWMSAFAYFGERHHWRVVPLVHAGCSMGIASTGRDPVGNCGSTWWPAALRRISDLHPRVLIAAQYYDPRVPTAQMYTGLRQELAAFNKRVARVILVEDPPRHPLINPVDCLLRRGATLGDCTLRLPAELVAEHSTIRNIVVGHTRDRYLKTRRWFCFAGKCPMVIGRTIAFRDTNHMTVSYARQIAPAVAAALGQLISPRRAGPARAHPGRRPA